MKTVYEKLLENKDYAKYVSSLGTDDREYVENFAVNLSKYADDVLANLLSKLGSTNVSKEDVEQAIRDRTGGA